MPERSRLATSAFGEQRGWSKASVAPHDQAVRHPAALIRHEKTPYQRGSDQLFESAARYTEARLFTLSGAARRLPLRESRGATRYRNGCVLMTWNSSTGGALKSRVACRASGATSCRSKTSQVRTRGARGPHSIFQLNCRAGARPRLPCRAPLRRSARIARSSGGIKPAGTALRGLRLRDRQRTRNRCARARRFNPIGGGGCGRPIGGEHILEVGGGNIAGTECRARETAWACADVYAWNYMCAPARRSRSRPRPAAAGREYPVSQALPRRARTDGAGLVGGVGTRRAAGTVDGDVVTF